MAQERRLALLERAVGSNSSPLSLWDQIAVSELSRCLLMMFAWCLLMMFAVVCLVLVDDASLLLVGDACCCLLATC